MDPARFGRALIKLCPVLTPSGDVGRFARWILKYSREFGVDPALVAGLVYQQSRCRERPRSSYGTGLAMINHGMHARWLSAGRYRYWVLANGVWTPRWLLLDRFPFSRRALLHARPNIYFTAGLLSMFSRQCPAVGGHFRSVPHRHPVSHFVWGDQVQDSGVEDRILRARRRLLGYYHNRTAPARGGFEGIPLGCPLDGTPCKVTSSFGDDREGGRRRHTGIDLASDWGEPVRAVAPGKVVLAGVNLGRNRLQNLDPRLANMVPRRRMGPRGLLVKIDHGRGLTSVYMHLSAYTVRAGQKVSRGALLGYVGRTGMKTSDAHLHFALEHRGRHIDPELHLRPHLFPVSATCLGRRNAAGQDRGRLLRSRRKRSRRMALPRSP